MGTRTRSGTAMKKFFFDCGFHHGEGLQHFIDMLGIDSSWGIHAFEPNPECHANRRFGELISKKKLESRPDVQVFPHAVWIQDGETHFSQENHYESGSGSPADGKSILDGWGSQVTNLHGEFPGLQKPITVMCLDFSYLVKMARCAQQEIYCKMDIEGAEFPVLRKMIADDTVKYIKTMWVEFHERFIPGEDAGTKRDLLKELRKHTEVIEWH